MDQAQSRLHQLKDRAPAAVSAAGVVSDAVDGTMTAPQAQPATLHFGRFELQIKEQQLLVDGQPAALRRRALDLLAALVMRAGQLVTREQLLDLVWPGLVVEENNLSVQINALRKVLGNDIIRTIPGRGYRFVAPLAGAPLICPPAPVPVWRKANLPLVLAPLFGRADELRALAQSLDAHRLVTVLGAGGMGKTRLAQALLDQRRAHYRDGVCWVELESVAALASAELLAGTVAAALGLQLGAGEPLARLAQALAPLQLLLVLDNAEHVLDAAADLCQALLAKAPELRLLVTSQAPLRLGLERVWRLGGLAVPPEGASVNEAKSFGAVVLFVERAQAVAASFELNEANVAPVIAVCRRLDGLSLAIELAAARAPLLGAQQLAAMLSEPLRLLSAGRDRHAPDRQLTLRAALAWSYGLLAPAEQAVFHRLAVVVGSAALSLIQPLAADPQAEADDDERPQADDLRRPPPEGVKQGRGGPSLSCEAAWAVLDALGVLVDRSLVAVLEARPGDPCTLPRYRLLHGPRAFALELLDASSEAPLLRLRHAQTLSLQLERAEREHWAGDFGVRDWKQGAELDLDNARQAFQWAAAADRPELALRLAAALLEVLPISLHDERLALCEFCEALLNAAAAAAMPPALQRRAWGALRRAFGARRHQRARKAGLRALALARGQHGADGDAWPLFQALVDEAMLAGAEGDSEAARLALLEAQQLEDPAWPAARRVRFSHTQMWSAARLGDFGAALQQGRLCVSLLRAAGSDVHVGLGNLANMALMAGDAAASARTGEELVAELAGGRKDYDLAYARINLAAAYLAQGITPEARAQLQWVWPLALRFELYWAAYHLALLASLETRAADAVRLLVYAEQRCQALGQVCEPNEAATRDRALGLAEAALGADAVQQLRQQARVDDAMVAGLAFGAGLS